MLKDKVFIKSAIYQFPKIFQFGQANAACRFCKKIFCCTKCRDRHVDKVHPNVNTDCPLCASEILPIRQCESTKLNLEDEKLLCHIVDKHLPLRCRLCGDLFESREDFKSVGNLRSELIIRSKQSTVICKNKDIIHGFHLTLTTHEVISLLLFIKCETRTKDFRKDCESRALSRTQL